MAIDGFTPITAQRARDALGVTAELAKKADIGSGGGSGTPGPAGPPGIQGIPGPTGPKGADGTGGGSSTASNPYITMPAIRTISAKIFDRPDLRDYDQLDLTGANDCASILQRAMQDSANQGFELTLPVMNLTCASPITVIAGNNGGPRVRGQGHGGLQRVPGSKIHLAHAGIGMTFTPYGNGNTGFSNVGSRLREFMTYRDQPALPASPGSATAANGIVADAWSPGNFDYDIVLEGPDHTLEDLMFFNATKAMQVKHSGRLFFNRLKICGIKESIYFQDTYDSCYLNQIHDFPWFNDGHWSLFRYMLQNSFGLYFGRVDNMRIVNYFNIFKQYGLYFDYYNGETDRGNTFAPGPPAKINIVAPDLDEAFQAIRFSANCRNAEVEITQLTTQQLREAKQGANLIRMQGYNNKLRLISPYMDYAWQGHISIDDAPSLPPNTCHVVAPRIGYWNTNSQGSPALNQTGNGKLIIDGQVEVTGVGEPQPAYSSGTTKGPLVNGGVIAKLGEGFFYGTTNGSGAVTFDLPSFGSTVAGNVFHSGANVNPGYMLRLNGITGTTAKYEVIDSVNKTPIANTPVSFKWDAYA